VRRQVCRVEDLKSLAVSAPLLDVTLPRLLNALAEAPHVALVLDDFHRVSSPAARKSVAWFVARLPATLQLAFRRGPTRRFRLGRFARTANCSSCAPRTCGSRPAEADEFLNGRLGLDLCASDVRLLVSRTEGWPAGIYLAALSMANATDRHALVAAFDGVSAHVVDFLSGEVLVAHDPALQDFMIRTSILERLTAPLCDAVLDGTNSGESLHALGRSNLFLVRSTAVATGARCLSTASIYKALPKPLLKLRALP
jgi:LuxR family maltose regulon positive regulatory protein